MIDLNPSQPVVCAKERIDLHPSIAKWLPTAPLNRGNNPEVRTTRKKKILRLQIEKVMVDRTGGVEVDSSGTDGWWWGGIEEEVKACAISSV